jgi:3-dehydroquinate synthetase
MAYAAKISQVLTGFSETNILVETLKKYGLPTAMHFDIQEAMQVMQKDKKKASAGMQYVVLQKIGKAVSETIPMKSLEKLIKLYS